MTEEYVCTNPGCECFGKTDEEYINQKLDELGIVGEEREKLVPKLKKLLKEAIIKESTK